MTLAQKHTQRLLNALCLTICFSCLATDNTYADNQPHTGDDHHPLTLHAQLQAPLDGVAALGEDHVLIVHHHPQRINSNGLPDHPIQLIQAMTTLPVPAEQVMATLLNFGAYAGYMPHVNSSRIASHQDKEWLAHFRLSFRLPLVDVEPDVWMRYHQLSDTRLSERIERGDLDYALGLWHLYPINENKTLLVHTSWSDFGSASWLLRLAFAAQPDFERLSPVSAAALTLQALRQQISRDFMPTTLFASEDISPATLLPDFTKEQTQALAGLAKAGNVTLASTQRRIRTRSKPGQRARWLEYQPVTTLGLIDSGREPLTAVYSDLKHYPEHIRAIRRLQNIEQKGDQLKADWRLGFDFAIFTLNIDFTAVGTWQNDTSRFDFVSDEGDFTFLYGRWQWFAVNDTETLVQFSSAHDLNPDASWLLEAVRDIPHNQLFSGIFIGSQLIEGHRKMLLNAPR